MSTSNRNMVVFLFKNNENTYTKCTELSLKQKEGIKESTFHLPCFSEGQLVLRKQRMVEPGYRNRSCTAPCSCVPVQSEIKQNQQLFTVNWSNQQLFTVNCSYQQLFTVNCSNQQLFTVNWSNQQLFTVNWSNQQLFTVNWSNKQSFTLIVQTNSYLQLIGQTNSYLH